jgi:hypothetical protein
MTALTATSERVLNQFTSQQLGELSIKEIAPGQSMRSTVECSRMQQKLLEDERLVITLERPCTWLNFSYRPIRFLCCCGAKSN